MGFRLNIAFSFGVHALLMAVVCATRARGSGISVSLNPICLIALVEGLSDDSSCVGKNPESLSKETFHCRSRNLRPIRETVDIMIWRRLDRILNPTNIPPPRYVTYLLRA